MINYIKCEAYPLCIHHKCDCMEDAIMNKTFKSITNMLPKSKEQSKTNLRKKSKKQRVRKGFN